MPGTEVVQEQVRCLLFDPGRGRALLGRRPEIPGDGDVLVQPYAIGIDGTDEGVARGQGGGAPEPGREDLVLGHEALLRVVEGPGFREGDLAVPLVRRGCDACAPCGRGRSDVCETGRFREHGIRKLDGWFADRALARAEELVRVPEALGLAAVLTEPLSIVAKGLEHARAVRKARLGEDLPRDARALVVGLGSLGSMATLLLRERGYQVHAMDRAPHPLAERFCEAIGADLSKGPPAGIAGPDGFDLVVETPGALEAIADALQALARNGVLVTLGTPHGVKPEPVEGARMVRELVVENQSVLGSVNSSRAHFEEALRVLQAWQACDARVLDLLLSTTFEPREAERALEADAPLKKVVVWG